MGESYLLSRKASLLAKTDETNPNLNKTIEEIANINQALGSSTASTGDGGTIDVTTLAKEATVFDIKNRLPILSDGTIPVSLPVEIIGKDRRVLTTNTTIPEGSYFAFLKVIEGDVTIDGLTYSTGEYLNFEACYPLKHAEIILVIPTGKSVRLVRGF